MDVMDMLISAGVNVLSNAKHDGWTALHKAAEMGNAQLVEKLLAAGADVHAHTLPDGVRKNGATPLDLATNPAVRKLLNDHGA